MSVLGDYRIEEKGKAVGDYIYRDRTISSQEIAKEAMLLEEKYDYIKVFFMSAGRRKMIQYKGGFEGPAKNNSEPRIDGDVVMRKGELTLNYQLPIMRNGAAFVVDTNHNREVLRRLLKKEKTEHYEIFYKGNTPSRRRVEIELGPYVKILSDIDIGKNKDGISHIMSLSPTDRAFVESLQKDLKETKEKLEEKSVAKIPPKVSKPKGRPKKKQVIEIIKPELAEK